MELVFPFLGTVGIDRMSALISKRTRQEFREYFVGTSLRIIGKYLLSVYSVSDPNCAEVADGEAEDALDSSWTGLLTEHPLPSLFMPASIGEP